MGVTCAGRCSTRPARTPSEATRGVLASEPGLIRALPRRSATTSAERSPARRSPASMISAQSTSAPAGQRHGAPRSSPRHSRQSAHYGHFGSEPRGAHPGASRGGSCPSAHGARRCCPCAPLRRRARATFRIACYLRTLATAHPAGSAGPYFTPRYFLMCRARRSSISECLGMGCFCPVGGLWYTSCRPPCRRRTQPASVSCRINSVRFTQRSLLSGDRPARPRG